MADLAEAQALLQAGRLGDAIDCLQALLRERPNDGAPLANLASALRRAGRVEESIQTYERALAAMPDSAELWFNAANAWGDAGDTKQAEHAYRNAIALAPAMHGAWFNLGRLQQQHDRHDEAERCYAEAARLAPAFAPAHINRGNCLRALGRLDEAIAAHGRAIELAPGSAEARLNLGNALRDARRDEAADAAYGEALARDPALHTARLARIELHLARGARAAALAALAEADTAYPDHAAYPFRRARLLLEDKLHRLALPFIARAAALSPSDARIANAHGYAQQALGDSEGALASFDRARKLEPGLALAHANYGQLARDLGHVKEGIEALRLAVRLDPGDAGAIANLVDALVQTGFLTEAIALADDALSRELLDPAGLHTALGHALCSAGRIEECLEHLGRALARKPEAPQAISNLLFAMLYSDTLEAEAKGARHHELASRLAPVPMARTSGARAGGKLRIAYLSADFRRHPVGFFVQSLLEHHDRERFQVSCYGDSAHSDEVTTRIASLADRYVACHGESDAELAARIRHDRIDVLFDLAGHTAFNRLPLFALRPARCHATYMGYPFTSGLAAMDLLIGDAAATPPEDDALYTERIVRLPHSLFCFTAHPTAPAVSGLPAAENGHLTFGCFNNFAKLTPSALELFARVLQEVPDARLVMRALGLNDPATCRRVMQAFAQAGIAAHRIDLLPPVVPIAEFLRGYERVDIALDPIPFNGGTTTVEALWQGVPVLTLPGRGLFARMGASIMTTAGLPEFIATDAHDHARIARGWASRVDALASLREGLRPRVAATTLFDGARYTRGFERSLLAAIA